MGVKQKTFVFVYKRSENYHYDGDIQLYIDKEIVCKIQHFILNEK